MNLYASFRRHLIALRLLIVLTALALAYPLAVTVIGLVPGLHGRAQGSLVRDVAGHPVGSRLIGQSFTTAKGDPVPRYFQSRPSAAGDGYDGTSSSASNLGPESIVDTLSADPDKASTSLLTQVCARSRAIGTLEHVDGRRPYCTAGGVGAVLIVFRRDGLTGPITRVVSANETGRPFLATYHGVAVESAKDDVDYVARGGVPVPIRGDAPSRPAVPADAVTSSASGLDPDISPAYAALQVPRVARVRGLRPDVVRRLVKQATHGRTLGFLGSPGVDVLELNESLDRLDANRSEGTNHVAR